MTRSKAAAAPVDHVEDAGQFEAYAAVFDNVDSDGDVIRKGAFSDTLREWEASGRPIPVLWGHNMADPEYNIGKVIEATEDPRGLRIRAVLDLDTPKGAAAHRLLKEGRVANMSFAFDVRASRPVTVDGVRATELQDLLLHEVSVVPIGANRATEILGVKHAGAPRRRIRERLVQLYGISGS